MARTVLHSRLEDGIAATSGVQEKIEDVTAALSRIQEAIEAMLPPGKPTPEAFNCLRVLNQVEDLVTDHEFDRDKNNTSLKKRLAERPTKDCHAKLQSDRGLAERFLTIYSEFPDPTTFEDRAKRYVEIDQLRHDIIRHFGASRPSHGKAGGGA